MTDGAARLPLWQSEGPFVHLRVELRLEIFFFVLFFVEAERVIDQACGGGVCAWEISAVAP